MVNEEFPGIPPGTPVNHADLYRFGALHSVVVNEAQEQFIAWLGPYERYDFDAVARTLSFDGRALQAQLLGSHAYEPDTWLWSWGNPGYQSPEMIGVTDAARWLRDASPDRERAWQLRTRVFPLDGQLSAGGAAGWPLLYACYAWLRPRAVYNADYGTGRFFASIHDESVPPVRPDPVTLPRLTVDAFGATGLPAAELLQTYANWHGLSCQVEPDRITVRYPAGSEFTFHLDEYQRPGRVTGGVQDGDMVPGSPMQ